MNVCLFHIWVLSLPNKESKKLRADHRIAVERVLYLLMGDEWLDEEVFENAFCFSHLRIIKKTKCFTHKRNTGPQVMRCFVGEKTDRLRRRKKKKKVAMNDSRQAPANTATAHLTRLSSFLH